MRRYVGVQHAQRDASPFGRQPSKYLVVHCEQGVRLSETVLLSIGVAVLVRAYSWSGLLQSYAL
jgi:hypothetical protein